LENT
jgi:hypothetical protein